MVDSPIGLVLSGGGARGAYEAGVLQFIAERHPELLERARIITGSSVGAVNGTFLASRGLTPTAVTELADLWRSLDLEELLALSNVAALKTLGSLSLTFARRGLTTPASGVLDARRLFKLVNRSVNWEGLHHYIRSGRFDAIALAATDISSGKTRLFVEGRAKEPGPRSDFDVELVDLELRHVAASASIPLLFVPIKVDGRWYMDGGVRYNTPLSPALSLGARALIIIGVQGAHAVSRSSHRLPSVGQVAGTLFDSIFLDRIAYDLDRLVRINHVVEIAELLAGGNGEPFRRELVSRGRRPYRTVPFVAVRPREDIGKLAGEHIFRTAKSSRSFLRLLAGFFGDGEEFSDAGSFLLFDGAFASRLIDQGYEDAERANKELEELKDQQSS